MALLSQKLCMCNFFVKRKKGPFEMKKFLIIDGNSIINRAFYGIRLLSNKHGLFTNGIYGFLNIMFKNIDEINPDYIAVTFDLKKPTFRHKMYTEYKAQRKPMPEELRMQLPVLKEVLSAMNIYIMEKEGYEADDIIGTVSRICDESNVECLILTGDKDDLQLASNNTKVLLTVTKGGNTTVTVCDEKEVFDRYSVTPVQFIDVKGLMGDTSDNIPGVKGIGEKTAINLISQYNSIEGVYEHIDEIKGATGQKLKDGEEMAYLSKKLCTIDRFVPLDFSLDDALTKTYDDEKLEKLFINLEFSSFMSRINKEEIKPSIEYLPCERSYEKIEADDQFIYRIYTVNGEIYSVAYIKNGLIKYIINDITLTTPLKDIIKDVFERETTMKIGSGIKEDIVLLDSLGIDYGDNYFDTKVCAYVLNPSRNSYEICENCLDTLEIDILKEEDLLGKGAKRKEINTLSKEDFEGLISNELTALRLLYEKQKEKIEENNQTELLYNIEFPLTKVLAAMEVEGFMVNKDELIEFSEMLKGKIETLEKQIYKEAGEEFNILSPKQLGVILFEKMELPVVKKTKTGYSTDADVLEKLKIHSPVVGKVIEYRKLTKLKSTYADGLSEVISPLDKKIHSKFNQTVTMTGRISSTEPNLQNIPMRSELGREIRKMFVPTDSERILVDADYSQIELRILAHIADDEIMINAFKNNVDIHTTTAMNVFGLKEDEVTALDRTRAKAVNFGIVYGMGSFSLSQDLGITNKEAKAYIDGYFEKYSNVRAFMTNVVEEGKQKGYVETLFGRKRYLPELRSSNFIQRSAAERMAMNTPIQGTAADIIKIAMVKVYKALKENNLKSKLILQVHDELIIEAYKDEEEIVKKLLKECMESACEMKVPLSVEVGSGESWYLAH